MTTATDAFMERIDQAVADWRRWATDLAAGRPGPAAQEILEAAAILAIRDPGLALDDDARAIAGTSDGPTAADAERHPRLFDTNYQGEMN